MKKQFARNTAFGKGENKTLKHLSLCLVLLLLVSSVVFGIEFAHAQDDVVSESTELVDGLQTEGAAKDDAVVLDESSNQLDGTLTDTPADCPFSVEPASGYEWEAGILTLRTSCTVSMKPSQADVNAAIAIASLNNSTRITFNNISIKSYNAPPLSMAPGYSATVVFPENTTSSFVSLGHCVPGIDKSTTDNTLTFLGSGRVIAKGSEGGPGIGGNGAWNQSAYGLIFNGPTIEAYGSKAQYNDNYSACIGGAAVSPSTSGGSLFNTQFLSGVFDFRNYEGKPNAALIGSGGTGSVIGSGNVMNGNVVVLTKLYNINQAFLGSNMQIKKGWIDYNVTGDSAASKIEVYGDSPSIPAGGVTLAYNLYVMPGATLTCGRTNKIVVSSNTYIQNQGAIINSEHILVEGSGYIQTEVSFDSEGGSAPVPASKMVTYRTATENPCTYGTLPAVTKPGKVFNGWMGSSPTDILTDSSPVEINTHTLVADWVGNGPFIVTGGVQRIDWDFNETDNLLEIKTSTPLHIKDATSDPTTWRIVVQSPVEANFSLDGVHINTTHGSALEIPDKTSNVNVNIDLGGSDNELICNGSTLGGAGISVGKNVTLTIDGNAYGDNINTLKASGYLAGAGIGKTFQSTAGGTVILNGGHIVAAGGLGAAAIGGSSAISLDKIIIHDAIVDATAGANSPAIGAGMGGTASGNEIDGDAQVYTYVDPSYKGDSITGFENGLKNGLVVFRSTDQTFTQPGEGTAFGYFYLSTPLRVSDHITIEEGATFGTRTTLSLDTTAEIINKGNLSYGTLDIPTDRDDKTGKIYTSLAFDPQNGGEFEGVTPDPDGKYRKNFLFADHNNTTGYQYSDLPHVVYEGDVESFNGWVASTGERICNTHYGDCSTVLLNTHLANADWAGKDFVITGESLVASAQGDYDYDGETLNIHTEKPVSIANKNPGTPSDERIIIKAPLTSESAPVQVVLAGINLQSSDGHACIDIQASSSTPVHLYVGDAKQVNSITTFTGGSGATQGLPGINAPEGKAQTLYIGETYGHSVAGQLAIISNSSDVPAIGVSGSGALACPINIAGASLMLYGGPGSPAINDASTDNRNVLSGGCLIAIGGAGANAAIHGFGTEGHGLNNGVLTTGLGQDPSTFSCKMYGDNVSLNGPLNLLADLTIDEGKTLSLRNGGSIIFMGFVNITNKGTLDLGRYPITYNGCTIQTSVDFVNGTTTQNYTLTYGSDEGIGTYGDAAKPVTPSPGHTFEWNMEQDGTGDVVTPTTPIELNTHTIYGIERAASYTLTFDNAGGEGGPTTATATYEAPLPPLADQAPTKEGYGFLGYFDDSKRPAVKYYNSDLSAALDTFNETKDVKLTAHWSEFPYIVEGGTKDVDYTFDASTLTFKVLTNRHLSIANKTRVLTSIWPIVIDSPEGAQLSLAGVVLESDSGPAIQVSDKVQNSVKLFINDSASNSFISKKEGAPAIQSNANIFFNTALGANGTGSITCQGGSKAAAISTLTADASPVVTCLNATINLYGGNEAPAVEKATMTIEGNVVVSAASGEKATVDPLPAPVTFNKGILFTKKTNPGPYTGSLKGNVSLGSFTVMGNLTIPENQSITVDSGTITVPKDVTLLNEGTLSGTCVALETGVVATSVDFVSPTTLDGSSNAKKNVTYWNKDGECKYGDSAAPLPAKTGYTFEWNLAQDGSGNTISATSSVLLNTHTVYGYYRANVYTITFDNAGGEGGPTTASATYDQPLPAIEQAPTTEGSGFLGYFDDSQAPSVKYYDAELAPQFDAYTNPADITLTAHWAEYPYVIQGGTLGTDYVYDMDNSRLLVKTDSLLTISNKYKSGIATWPIVVDTPQNANLTLNGLSVTTSNSPAITVSDTCTGTVSLFLPDDVFNELISNYQGSPAIQTGASASLVIDKMTGSTVGDGKLYCKGANNAAGIGGGINHPDVSNISIYNGHIIAIGGANASGIGSVNTASVSNIAILGGYNLIFIGGENASAIGGDPTKDSGIVIDGDFLALLESGSDSVEPLPQSVTATRGLVFSQKTSQGAMIGTLYGSVSLGSEDNPYNLTLPCDLTVGDNQTLKCATITVNDGITLLNDNGGTIDSNEITCNGSGKVVVAVTYDAQGGTFKDTPPTQYTAITSAGRQRYTTPLPVVEKTNVLFKGYILADGSSICDRYYENVSQVALNGHDIFADWDNIPFIIDGDSSFFAVDDSTKTITLKDKGDFRIISKVSPMVINGWHFVTADSSDVTAELVNVRMEAQDKSPFTLGADSTLNLRLANDTVNSFDAKNDQGCPGIRVGDRATLNIMPHEGELCSESSLTVYGGPDAAGIGAAPGDDYAAINIGGVHVTAYGGENGAGIGASGSESAEPITLTDSSYVTAYGGTGANGIGSGKGGSCAGLTLDNAILFASSGSVDVDPYVGAGNDQNGLVYTKQGKGNDWTGSEGKILGSTVTLHTPFTLPSTLQINYGQTLNLQQDDPLDQTLSLTVPTGVTLKNNGTISVTKNAQIEVMGTMENLVQSHISIVRGGSFVSKKAINDPSPTIFFNGFVDLEDGSSMKLTDNGSSKTLMNGTFDMDNAELYCAHSFIITSGSFEADPAHIFCSPTGQILTRVDFKAGEYEVVPAQEDYVYINGVNVQANGTVHTYGEFPEVKRPGYSVTWKTKLDKEVQATTLVDPNCHELFTSFSANTYTISFDAAGGTGGPSAVAVTFDKALPEVQGLPSRDGYTFTGYYSEKTGGTEFYSSELTPADMTYTIPNNTVLYAQWNKNPEPPQPEPTPTPDDEGGDDVTPDSGDGAGTDSSSDASSYDSDSDTAGGSLRPGSPSSSSNGMYDGDENGEDATSEEEGSDSKPATVVDEDSASAQKEVWPWWLQLLVGLAIAIAVILLILLIFFLVKRRKKDDEQNRQATPRG